MIENGFCQDSWHLDVNRGVVAQRNTPSGERLQVCILETVKLISVKLNDTECSCINETEWNKTGNPFDGLL